MPEQNKQIGARVDAQLHNYFKNYVKFEHDADRGPLGKSHETAMKYYVAHQLINDPDQLKAFADSKRIDSDPEIIERQMINYMDDVGEDLANTACTIEEASAQPEDRTSLRELFDGSAIHIWHRVRAELFDPKLPDKIEKEKLLEAYQVVSQFGGKEGIEKRLRQLKEFETEGDQADDTNSPQPMAQD